MTERWVRVVLEGPRSDGALGFYVGTTYIVSTSEDVKSVEDIDPPEDLRDGDVYIDADGFVARRAVDTWLITGSNSRYADDYMRRPLTLLVRDGKPVQR